MLKSHVSKKKHPVSSGIVTSILWKNVQNDSKKTVRVLPLQKISRFANKYSHYEKTHPHSILQVPTTQLAKMSIDPKFVELTADVLEIF